MKYRIEYKRYLLLLVAFMLTGTESYAVDPRRSTPQIQAEYQQHLQKQRNLRSQRRHQQIQRQGSQVQPTPLPPQIEAPDSGQKGWLDIFAGRKVERSVRGIVNISPFNMAKIIRKTPDEVEKGLLEEKASKTFSFCIKWLMKPFCSEIADVLTPLHWINNLVFPRLNNGVNASLRYCGLRDNQGSSVLAPVKSTIGHLLYVPSMIFIKAIWGSITTMPSKEPNFRQALNMCASIAHGYVGLCIPGSIATSFLWKWMGSYYLKEFFKYAAPHVAVYLITTHVGQEILDGIKREQEKEEDFERE